MNKLYVTKVTPFTEETLFSEAFHHVGERRKNKVMQYKGNKDKARSLAAGLLFCYGYRALEGLKNEAAVASSSIEPGKIERKESIIPEEGAPALHGKPGPVILSKKEAPQEKKIYYNLSHSGDYAACLMGEREVGLDIQERRPIREGFAERFFKREEQAYLEQLKVTRGEKEMEDAFFTLWTLKEAYVKYSGRGMGEGFFCFSVLPLLKEGKQEIQGKICRGYHGKLTEDCFWGCITEAEENVVPEILTVFQLL